MANKPPLNAADFIQSMNINGLEGRMLRLPMQKKRAHGREILLLYGHHAQLERWWGLVENVAEYGNVTMPDLPGFGDMDSFAKIHKQPTIDNFADYLAAFVKLRYRRKRITIIGISFGFVIATRMLQRYPELAKRVDLLVSMVGFMHRDDFVFKPYQRRFFGQATRLFATRPVAYIIKHAFLNRLIIQSLYLKLPNGKRRMIEVGPIEFKKMLTVETSLWQINDVRTHWLTTNQFLKLDNCKVKVNLPVWHIASEHDHYFNNFIVEQHMRVVFNGYEQVLFGSKAHTPSVVADKKQMAIMLPSRLRRELSRQP